MPLTEAVIDGNPAVIIAAPGSIIVPAKFTSRIDQEAYALVWTASPAKLLGDGELPQLTAIVGPADRLPSSLTVSTSSGPVSVRPVATAPVPVIVDQSALPGAKPLTPKQQEAGYVPSSITAVAQNIAAAVTVRSASLGTPTYVLAHENLVAPLLSALSAALPSHIKPELTELFENKPSTRAFLAGQRAGFPSFLPVYTVRSIDQALDFVTDDVAAPAAAYVFAAHSFGAYAFNFLKNVQNVYLNSIPAEALALGPYVNGKDEFSFTLQANVEISRLRGDVQPPQSAASLDELAKIKARKLYQHPGQRIDFFGGSE